jgi:quercetin dioxygenase-like cupin family protein
MLSQIENGRSEPSVATLYGLVSALSISVDNVLGTPASANGSRAPACHAPILRAEDRATLVMDGGVRWERLTADADPHVEALLVTYPAGSSSSGSGLMRHSGHEYGYLIEGELVVQIGFETFTLRPGDALSFESATPHLYRNDSTKLARGIWHVVEHDPAKGGPGPG